MNWRGVFSPALIVALAIMTTAAVGMQSAISRFQIYLRKKPIYAEPIGGVGATHQLLALPSETEHFIRLGQDIVEAPETLETLGTENYLTRTYIQKQPGPDGKRHIVQLHTAYYTGMIDTVPHVPERCLTGGGMDLVGGPWTVNIPLRTEDWRPSADAVGPLKDKLYTTRLSGQYSSAIRGGRVNLPRQLTPSQPLQLRVSEFGGSSGAHLFAGYFFVANGGWVASAEGVRTLAFDLQADYAYYLKVQVGSTEAATADELGVIAGALLDDLLGEIMTCVPDWPRVQNKLWPPEQAAAQTLGGRQP